MLKLNDKREVALFMRRLYELKLTTTSGGNISKKHGKQVLISASATDKSCIRSRQICVIDKNGLCKSRHLKPSMETEMHLMIYKTRPDVGAIIHAHPVFASSFTATDASINTALIAEARFVLGEPVLASYKLMGTGLLAREVSDKAKNANVILMQNHGIIALGSTLLEAFDRIEVLEAAAKMTLISRLLGPSNELTLQQKQEIDKLAGRIF